MLLLLLLLCRLLLLVLGPVPVPVPVPAVCSRLMMERPLGVELAELPCPDPSPPPAAPSAPPDPEADAASWPSSLLLVVSAMDPCFLRRLFAAMDLGRNLSRPLASIIDSIERPCVLDVV